MACSSAYWKYVDPNRAILVPMAIVLSGFPPLRYGDLGKGSVHAKLDALVAHSVDADALHVMMTDVLQLGGESDRRFKPDGALYKLAKGAFASQIMWYKDRCLTEARHVCARMRDAWNTAFRFVDFGDSGGVDAHNMLVKWGGLIRRQFDIDNLHLTAVLSGGGLDTDRIISCFQRFHESNAEQMECIKELIKMHLATTCSVDSLHHELSRMKKVLEEHGQSVAKTGQIVINLSSPRTTPSKRRRLTDATAAAVMGGAPAAAVMGGALAAAGVGGGAPAAAGMGGGAPAAPVPIRRQPHFAPYVLPLEKVPEGRAWLHWTRNWNLRLLRRHGDHRGKADPPGAGRGQGRAPPDRDAAQRPGRPAPRRLLPRGEHGDPKRPPDAEHR